MNGHVNEKDEGLGGPNLLNSTDNKSNNTKNNDDNSICRDFLRNVCYRNKRCKFRHPDEEEFGSIQSKNNRPKSDLVFCHDFHNGSCTRNLCRFIHCTIEEEDFYMRTNRIHPHLLEQAVRKGQVTDNTHNGDVPICKDFLAGECSKKRGGKCKFRHLTQSEYDQEIYKTAEGYVPQDNYKPPGNVQNSLPTPDPKRLRYDPHVLPDLKLRERDLLFRFLADEGLSRNDLIVGRDMEVRDHWDRERERDRDRDRRGVDEILLLRKQLDILKKEIISLKKDNSDLRATNDFLLEKMTPPSVIKHWRKTDHPSLRTVVTTLGLSKAAASVTTVTVPAVSMATTIPVTSVQPLTAAQVSHPLSITSDGTVGSVVTIPTALAATAPARQAQAGGQALASTAQVTVAATSPAVVGSVGGVQVSLSQAPALNAVSLSTVNLNPTISPSNSLTTSIAAAPGSAHSLAQAISLSGGTGHLVTYPIMTQPALRPQLQ